MTSVRQHMADSSCVSVRILLVLLLLDSVYGQDQISAYAGSEVRLNCSYAAPSPNLNVFWRYRDTYNLVDIIDGGEDLSDQDPRFRERVVTSPGRYAAGDFSVLLKDVRLKDTGPYNCDIPRVDYQHKLLLTVTVRPTDGPTTAKPKVTAPPSGDGVSVRGHSYCFILLSVTLLVSMWMM